MFFVELENVNQIKAKTPCKNGQVLKKLNIIRQILSLWRYMQCFYFLYQCKCKSAVFFVELENVC